MVARSNLLCHDMAIGLGVSIDYAEDMMGIVQNRALHGLDSGMLPSFGDLPYPLTRRNYIQMQAGKSLSERSLDLHVQFFQIQLLFLTDVELCVREI